MCAKESLSGSAIVIYPDTLIKADQKFDKNADAVIWTKKVSNPEAYGVVKLNEHNEIIDLVEKPKTLFQIWQLLEFIILRKYHN